MSNTLGIDDNTRDVCARAVRTWGTNAQLDQAVEELAETIIAINHAKRGRDGSAGHLQEECADAILMLHQVAHIAGEAGVQEHYKRKRTRVRERLLNAGAFDAP